MAGYDAHTGRPIHGDARIAQAIKRLIMTDGDLVMRRHISCDLRAVIGAPANPVFQQAVCAAIALAIYTHEKRVDLKMVRFAGSRDGLTPDEAADGNGRILISCLSRETGNMIELSEAFQ